MSDPKDRIKRLIRQITLFLGADIAIVLLAIFVFMSRSNSTSEQQFPAWVHTPHLILGAIATVLLFQLLRAAGRSPWLGVLLSFIATLFCPPVQWMIIGGYISKVRSAQRAAAEAPASEPDVPA